jgi:ribose transport system ATP-binding protein
VIIMDEPTSAISEQEIKSLFRLIQQLKQRGIGIVYITHKLDELAEIADELTVFRDGRFVADRRFHEVTHDEIVRMMAGRGVSQASFVPAQPADEVLRVRDMSLRHPDRADDYAVRHVSFAVHRGEIVGLFGVMGAGRTELLQILFGLHPGTSSGQILVDSKPVTIRSPGDAIRLGIALAPEDRKAEGLVLTMSVAENLALPSLARTTRLGMLRANRERTLARSYVERLRIKTSSVNAPVVNLSGGNQQKVVVAKWLAMEPKVLLLDEPTRGIDINAKREIHTLINDLARAGLGIVMASSELPDLMALADRIVVLAEGCVTAEFARGKASEEEVLHAALPVGKLQKAVSA